jgi:predicted transcriptional regulator of viral defense system
MFGNKAVVQRLGFILQRTRKRRIAKSLPLLGKIKSDFTYPLDPHLGKKGRLSEKWQILDNVGLRG